MKRTRSLTVVAVLFSLVMLLSPEAADARIRLKNICRIKGQEEVTLHGLGLVTGLRGTGDGGDSKATIIALAKTMELMNVPIPVDAIKNAKNVALVMVRATVPAEGARQGDKINCVVSSFGGADSLKGGEVFTTPLVGPLRGSNRVYALAEGRLQLPNKDFPTRAEIHGGCRLEEDFFSVFQKNNQITLVLDHSYADFQVAQDIAELISSQLRDQGDGDETVDIARAIDQKNIVISIPKKYHEDPVLFVSLVVSVPLLEPQVEARVVIDAQRGTIVMGADVEIGAVVISHRGITVDTGADSGARKVVGIDPTGTSEAKLQALVEALQAVNVEPADMVDILVSLQRTGKLHGKLIIND